jgi:1-deoxy-D-xylulose-5-phosphate reductoisomerase
MKGLAILGSTGSIGTNTLRVVDSFPDRLRVVSLAAGRNVERLAEQVAHYRPSVVSVADEETRAALGRLVDLSGTHVGVGTEGMVAAATAEGTTTVVAAAVGAVGLVPTYRAIEAGHDIALANKETLVMAGSLMVAAARAHGCRLLPIDSEHCALHQCLDGRKPESVRRLVLTASGGPFRNRDRSTFASITPAEALNHPTWNMGRKITIDSATLMNKGLEVIEAHWLFGIPESRIEVLVHPQSVVHSMVEFVDGTVLAQLGVTDMRLPIQYALSYPECWEAAIPGLDFGKTLNLEFHSADHEHFPCVGLAYDALRRGGTVPAVLNAANEEAVDFFLSGRLPFAGIPETIGDAMGAHQAIQPSTIEDVLDADAWARSHARRLFERRAAAQVSC